MHVTMVKKRLVDGEPCRKCMQVEDMLRERGVWERIDAVVWAEEGDPKSPGMLLSARHSIETAPFFVVQTAGDQPKVYRSALKLLRDCFRGDSSQAKGSEQDSPPPTGGLDNTELNALAAEYQDRSPKEILRWALSRFGNRCGIAFSGAEDVVLVDIAAKIGHPFSVFTLDTGRLHPETYQFLERVRSRYGVEISVAFPDAAQISEFVRNKGLFSFLEDGHQECCGIRKVAPLRRMLAGYHAWATGQRRDQSPDTRSRVVVIQQDPQFAGASDVLVKVNPLANWTSKDVWNYIREHDVPYNPLHERGFVSIGCAPCTRAVLPGQHEREGRWWWEQAEHKECGLHREN